MAASASTLLARPPSRVGGGTYIGDIVLEPEALLNQTAWTDSANGELRFWGQLDGQALSSTRVEGWAIIGAHLIPKPIHLGIDNAAALRHLNDILQGTTGTWRRPWGMQPDGDMWAILDDIVSARGKHATRGTKVKGHATDEDVRKGLATHSDKQGNDSADKMVHRGYDSYGLRRRALCVLHDERWNHYATMVGKIQRMMICIIAATRKRRDEVTGHVFSGGGRPQRIVHATAPPLGDPLAARRIRTTSHADAITGRPGNLGWRGLLAGYLSELHWVPREATSHDMGCSWLELLIDFELSTLATVRAASLLLQDGASLLRREGSIGSTIKLFQAEVLQQLRDRFTADVRQLFAPCRGRSRLSCLGIRTSVACFQAWPSWDDARHREILCRILAQRGIDLARAREGLAGSEMVLTIGSINMSRPASWRPRHTNLEEPQLVTVAMDGGTASSFPVQCSKCGGTHILSERPSLTCSPRIYCQHCGTLVRLRRCRCVTCGNFMEKCDVGSALVARPTGSSPSGRASSVLQRPTVPAPAMLAAVLGPIRGLSRHFRPSARGAGLLAPLLWDPNCWQALRPVAPSSPGCPGNGRGHHISFLG